MEIKKNKLHNTIQKILLDTFFKKEKSSKLQKVWNKVYQFSLNKYLGPISGKIHNFPVVYNNGYTYPITSRRFRTFNNPLLELVVLTSKDLKRKINVIDVGAAIGDTAFFILANYPDCINKIVCIDGDEEFFNYLKSNTKEIKSVESIKALLTDSNEMETADLIRTHLGTASAQGTTKAKAISLDNLILNRFDLQNPIDLIKIDVDGYDGKILDGASSILNTYKPNVIYEWHPILYKQTHNDKLAPFVTLENAGYTNFIWFDKYGRFSHFDSNSNKSNIQNIAELCLNGKHDYDWHYDIVAIHKDSTLSIVELAELQNAKNKVSFY